MLLEWLAEPGSQMFSVSTHLIGPAQTLQAPPPRLAGMRPWGPSHPSTASAVNAHQPCFSLAC